jgi:hypothetical protein
VAGRFTAYASDSIAGRRQPDEGHHRGGPLGLESLIFAIVLVTLIELTVILMILLTGRQERSVENCDTGALAVTREIRGCYPWIS